MLYPIKCVQTCFRRLKQKLGKKKGLLVVLRFGIGLVVLVCIGIFYEVFTSERTPAFSKSAKNCMFLCNIVLLHGDSKYHLVDTTGNGDGISIGDLPGHFWFTCCALELPVSIRVSTFWVGYCDTSDQCSNDAGDFNSPSKSSMIGC